MLDRWTRPLIEPLLTPLAQGALKLKLTPNTATLIGLLTGLGCLPALAFRNYPLALGLLLLNRLLDGLDGIMARQQQSTAYGAYLDIVCDMIVYGGFVYGFALAQPENAPWAAGLLFAFMGTSSSFLAFNALKPEEQKATDGRGLVFVSGLAEGTETLLFFIAMARWPYLFPLFAIALTLLCHITTLGRLIFLRKTLKPLA